MYKLNELEGVDDKDEGFIEGYSLVYNESIYVEDRNLLVVNNSEMEIRDLFIYTMNGLYSLKEQHKVIFVKVFGTKFEVVTRRRATPSCNDSLNVINMLQTGVSLYCSAPQLKEIFNEVRLEIESNKLKYEE